MKKKTKPGIFKLRHVLILVSDMPITSGEFLISVINSSIRFLFLLNSLY